MHSQDLLGFLLPDARYKMQGADAVAPQMDAEMARRRGAGDGDGKETGTAEALAGMYGVAK
jgi:hypothetical protein